MPELAGPGRLRARTRLITIAALALVVAAAAALILGGEVSGSRAGAAATGKASGSATVARRDLIETDTEAGTLSYADSRTVFNRLSGTITSLPAAGTVVKPGGVLFTVDNSPVVLMDGALPAYRTLAAGVADGPDVRELEQNLVALGDDPTHSMTVDDHFDAATTAAVERWQGATGQTQTGTVTLGQVVFLPGARRVSALSAALGSTGGSAAGSATGASLRLPPGAARPEFVDLTTPTTTTTTSTTTSTTAARTPRSGQPPAQSGASTPTLLALIALLRAEVAELKAARGTAGSGASSSGRSAATGAGAAATGATSGTRSAGAGAGASGASTSAASSGTGGGGSSAAAGAATAQAVLSTTSTQLVATVPLDATKQSEAVVGAPVTVQMPDGSTVDGRISQVAAAAQTTSSSSSAGASGSGAGAAAGGSSSSSSASSTVPVTIALHGHVRSTGLDQAAVSVNFEQQKALGVLSVPVTALLATAGGGYAIQPVDQPHHLIPVTPGLFAAGYVQISGSGIVPGLAVTDSQG